MNTIKSIAAQLREEAENQSPLSGASKGQGGLAPELRQWARDLETIASELMARGRLVRRAADAILGPMTAEYGRIMEDAPSQPITVSCGSHSVTLTADKFTALYRATDT